MGSGFRNISGATLVFTVLVLLFSSRDGLAQNPEDSEKGAESYCVLQVGDLDGNGTEDLVVSRRDTGQGPAASYVFLDGEKTIPDPPDRRFLLENASYVLRGPAAAPFACPPPESLESPEASSPRPGSARQLAAVGTKSIFPAAAEGASPVNRPPRYRIVELNSPDSFTNILTKGINATGQFVGQARVANGQTHAFFHDGAEPRDLGTLGGHSSVACSINDSGQIVGHSLTGEIDETGLVEKAFLSDGVSLLSLGRIWSHAFAINNRGQIVGDMRVESGNFHATLFEGGGEKDLGTLEGGHSFAFAVNEAGQIVGEADTTIPGKGQPSTRAFVFRNGTMHDLGSFGYFCTNPFEGSEEESCFERSSATDINNRDQIAGFSSTEDQGYQHAFLITGEQMEDLGTLGGNQSWAQAANDSGQVVGSSLTAGDAAYHAFLFEQGTMYDLNDLVDDPNGVSIWEALDINNFGQIVGLNYLLDPQYESIPQGGEFSFSDALGQNLRFEYWIALNSDECVDPRGQARIEVRIEGVAPDRENRMALRPYLNRWLPASPLMRLCDATGEWQEAALTLPAALQGQPATIRIRVNARGGQNVTVPLRRFTIQ